MHRSDRRTSSRLHFDRTFGRHRDHRRVDRAAFARRAIRTRGRPSHPVHQQPQANRAGHAQLSQCQRRVPDGRVQELQLRSFFELPWLRRLARLERTRDLAAVHGTIAALQRHQLQHGGRDSRQHPCARECDCHHHESESIHVPIRSICWADRAQQLSCLLWYHDRLAERSGYLAIHQHAERRRQRQHRDVRRVGELRDQQRDRRHLEHPALLRSARG